MRAMDLNLDALYVRQRLTAFVNRYEVYGPDEQTPVAFCQQRRFALREDLRFYSNEDMHTEVLRVQARRVVDIGGRYDVTEPDGTRVGSLERRAGRSLLRTTWALLDPDGHELAWLQERNVAAAAIRRIQNVIQLIPIIGLVSIVFDLIPIPYHFDVRVGDRIVGRHTRIRGWRDRYRMVIDGDPERRIDRRLVLAIAVALDALQSR